MLRKYQQDAVDTLFEFQHDRPGQSSIIVIPTGGGKTRVMAEIIRRSFEANPNCRGMILSHVKELLEQSNKTCTHYATTTGLPVESIGVYSAALKRREVKPLTIAGIQSVYKKGADFGYLDFIMIDECFVAGTMISTPKGEIPIDKVRCGDLVFNQCGVGTVEAVSCKPAPETYIVELSNGKKIECTGNHRFFTERGWCAAKELENGSGLFGIQDMRMLWESVLSLGEVSGKWEDKIHATRIPLEKAEILLSCVCEEIFPNIVEQSSKEKNKRQTERDETQTYTKRRERAIASLGSTSIVTRTRGWMESGACDNHSCGASKRNVSKLLQGGHWEQRENDCNRTGWRKPRFTREERKGSEENEVFGGIRVVGVSCKKRKSPVLVFNIQVSGHPSYFADGVAVHNCHLISQNKETMYRKFLSQAKISNSRVKVVGLTATPYRLQSGIIFGHKEKTFDNCCYAIGVRDLIDEGFLSPLVTMGTSDSPDLKNVRIRAGEYFSKDLDAILENADLVQSSVKEAIAKTSGRKSVLVFASSIRHAQMILDELKNQGQRANIITGETHPAIRDCVINGFRENNYKWLVNVAVLTTGFDAPMIDCVVVMRPTMSKGLWYQMVGRGFRLAPDKENCLILDFGDNALRHGCIDQIVVDAQGIELPAAKVKRCPSCNLIHRIGNIICPSCGYFKPKEEESLFPEKLSASQTNGEILAGRQPKQYEIVATGYTIYKKSPASDPCILETHETLEGKLIRCYHSLKHGLEFIVWKWLKSVGANGLPDKHWNMNKEGLQSQEWLDTIPKPIAIKAHINEKGYYQIDSYSFQSNRVISGGVAKG